MANKRIRVITAWLETYQVSSRNELAQVRDMLRLDDYDRVWIDYKLSQVLAIKRVADCKTSLSVLKHARH